MIVPEIYRTILSGIKQPFIPLYNLMLAINLAFKRKLVTENEIEFFYKQLFQLKDFHQWRNPNHEFVDITGIIDKTKFYAFKREILKIYPDEGRRVMEYIENLIG
jgi:hypothetical protein